jgi:rRNA maturation endonuclease Nob1
VIYVCEKCKKFYDAATLERCPNCGAPNPFKKAKKETLS